MDAETKNTKHEASPPVDKDLGGPNRTESATVKQSPIRTPIRPKVIPPTGHDNQASDHYALCVRETAGAAFMYTALAAFFKEADTFAFVKYRNQLLADAGDATDPIEIMMIEQIATAHFNIGRLHYKSITAEGLEGAKVYGALAIALTGEFRRSALALSAYRAAQRLPNATAGDDIAAEGPVAPSQKDPHSELASKPEGGNDGAEAIPFCTEPAAGRGGETEHPQETGANGRWSRPAVSSCAR